MYAVYEIEMITLFQGNNFTTNSRPSGYTFPVTWKNTQLPFINSSFYLMGWRIDNTAKWLSFDARINSVTLTGATFYFNPSTYSQIVYAQFGLILLKNKPGIVKMIYVGRLLIIKFIIAFWGMVLPLKHYHSQLEQLSELIQPFIKQKQSFRLLLCHTLDHIIGLKLYSSHVSPLSLIQVNKT
jgi:hypothetical protein